MIDLSGTMGININCRHCDRFLQCTHPGNRLRFLFLMLKRECVLVSYPFAFYQSQRKYKRPKLNRKTLIPPPDPRRWHVIEDTHHERRQL